MDGFILGTNYWPRRTGVNMWERWDPAAVDAELGEVAALGLGAVRIFLLWRDFQPGPAAVDPAALAKLDQFLALAQRWGLGVVPTCFTGHMSGENYDVPWRQGRCPYTDPELLRAQAFLLATLGRRYREHPALLFWDLANEPDIFRRPPSAAAGWLWARFLAGELRRADPHHPVTVGLHLGCLTADVGLRPADLAEACDFLSLHAYPMYTSLCPDPPEALRPGYLAAFAARLAAGMTGKGVLMEEFGTSSQLWGAAAEGAHHGTVLGSLLANGARGAFGWCFGDFACDEEPPYEATPYEAAFGLTDAAGRVKPSGEAWRGFAAFLAGSGLSGATPEPAGAAILIPDAYYDHPDGLTPERHAGVLFNAFVLAKQAGLDVDFLPARAAPGPYRLLIMPSWPRRGGLGAAAWRRVREFVRGGGVLYLSYDGFAAAELAELAGARLLGPRPGPGGVSFADRGLGTDLSCSPGVPWHLGVQPEAGRLLAADPALAGGLLEHHPDRGGVLLATWPLEWDLGRRSNPYPTDRSYLVYRRAGELAGLAPPVRPPSLEVRGWRRGEGRRLLAVNHGAQPVAVGPGGAGELAPGETRVLSGEVA
ncbi:MAG: hypothetical protein M0031_10785 [Thermaerobacter sp.]|nr:hypothetical protein [Thermaerobacter sp.]